MTHPRWRNVAVLAALAVLMAGWPQIIVSSGAAGAPSTPAGRAVERPDHDGPYKCGYLTEGFRGTTKSYSINLKAYYPAQAAGENSSADNSGAPYPTILMMPYAGSDETAYDFVAPRLVSWGLVIVCVGQNQGDPSSGNRTDVNEILDQLERDNATPAHRLACQLNRGAFGIGGHSRGGAWSVIDGCYVPRIRAVQAMAPALAQNDVDIMAQTFSKPLQVQVGRIDSSFYIVSLYTYRAFPPPKGFLDLANVGHGGPFQWDLAISFFFRYLLGLTEYDRFLYGADALDDAADATYLLNFTLPNGSFFPPNITVSAGELAPDEDREVDFTVAYEGFLPLGHPRGSFKWDFTSDGQVDLTGPYNTTASWSYTRAGPTRVSLWYELGLLRLGTNRTLTLAVNNPPPTIAHGANRSAAEDSALQFNAEGHDTPSDEGRLQYAWDFGDGAGLPFGDRNATGHTFRQAGNYSVKVTVRDDEGAEASDAVNVLVINLPPAASAEPGLTAFMDEEAGFTGAGNDTPSDMALLSYRWDFGDGSSSDWTARPEASHTYTRSGNFSARLLVRDDDSETGNCTVAVRIINVVPSAAVTFPRPGSSLQKDEEVDFSGSGEDSASDKPRLEYSWDFGDGNTSSWAAAARASHTYTRGGNVTAVLRVRDPDGATGASDVDFVVENQPPALTLVAPMPGATAEEDEPVAFSAHGRDTPSDAGLLRFGWEMDGRSFSGPEISAAFTTAGVHRFNLSVTDPEGASVAAFGYIFVTNPPPELLASVDAAALFVNGTLNFTAESVDTASDQASVAFLWDFGDGTRSTEREGSHSYGKAGTYKVRVTAEDDEGARDFSTFTVRVDERPAPPPPGGNERQAPAKGPPVALLAGAALLLSAAVTAVLVLRRRRRAR